MIKYFAVLPNSPKKQILTDKIFVFKVPAMHCICYKLEISWENIFAAILQHAKYAKIFNLENFRLYICSEPFYLFARKLEHIPYAQHIIIAIV